MKNNIVKMIINVLILDNNSFNIANLYSDNHNNKIKNLCQEFKRTKSIHHANSLNKHIFDKQIVDKKNIKVLKLFLGQIL